MLRKARLSVSVIILCILMAFTGCSSNSSNNKQSNTSSEENNKPVTLEFYNNVTGDVLNNYKKIAAKFTAANPNIKMEVVSQGSNFQNLMKVKMASNELPDLWTIHGWSVNLYSKYLRPLNDQTWYKKIEDTIKPTITDSKGKVFVLPLDIDKSGIVYNKGVLENLKLNVPKNWDEFLNVCDQIKKSGITPVFLAGKDTTNIASMIDRIAQPLLITDKSKNYANQLKNGTFNWDNWNLVSQVMLNLKSKGYLNTDLLTADTQTSYRNFAENKAVFLFQSNNAVQEILLLNPNAKIGMMPIPAYYKDDTAVLVGGERDAVGVWKDTKYTQQCLKFLNYLALPENMTLISSSFGLPAGLKGVTSNLGSLKDDYDKYQNARVSPVFDREYLPSGMWNTMQTVGGALLSGSLSVADSSKAMKNDYTRLRTMTSSSSSSSSK